MYVADLKCSLEKHSVHSFWNKSFSVNIQTNHLRRTVAKIWQIYPWAKSQRSLGHNCTSNANCWDFKYSFYSGHAARVCLDRERQDRTAGDAKPNIASIGLWCNTSAHVQFWIHHQSLLLLGSHLPIWRCKMIPSESSLAIPLYYSQLSFQSLIQNLPFSVIKLLCLTHNHKWQLIRDDRCIGALERSLYF